LYAKNWYKNSGNIIQDLREILAEYAYLDLDPQYITARDIREVLTNCFAKYAPECNKGIWIQEMLGWGVDEPY